MCCFVFFTKVNKTYACSFCNVKREAAKFDCYPNNSINTQSCFSYLGILDKIMRIWGAKEIIKRAAFESD